ncbi:50S ribosomal protein L24e [Haloarchaeobius sp. DFWS5]|uniref:50S ribosomal protein L24e n=1 Tax=Haloarchaeobius sp. DFWS5 TaxID=3446114 RepID=UPI003EC09446
MVKTRDCEYCGDDITPGTGTMFVHTDGTTVHFCSAKCEKNASLGREPRELEWTAQGAKSDAPTEESEE